MTISPGCSGGLSFLYLYTYYEKREYYISHNNKRIGDTMKMYIEDSSNYLKLTEGKHALTPADTHGMLAFSTIINLIVDGEMSCGSKKPFPIVFEDDKLPWNNSEKSASAAWSNGGL